MQKRIVVEELLDLAGSVGHTKRAEACRVLVSLIDCQSIPESHAVVLSALGRNWARVGSYFDTVLSNRNDPAFFKVNASGLRGADIVQDGTQQAAVGKRDTAAVPPPRHSARAGPPSIKSVFTALVVVVFVVGFYSIFEGVHSWMEHAKPEEPTCRSRLDDLERAMRLWDETMVQKITGQVSEIADIGRRLTTLETGGTFAETERELRFREYLLSIGEVTEKAVNEFKQEAAEKLQKFTVSSEEIAKNVGKSVVLIRDFGKDSRKIQEDLKHHKGETEKVGKRVAEFEAEVHGLAGQTSGIQKSISGLRAKINETVKGLNQAVEELKNVYLTWLIMLVAGVVCGSCVALWVKWSIDAKFKSVDVLELNEKFKRIQDLEVLTSSHELVGRVTALESEVKKLNSQQKPGNGRARARRAEEGPASGPAGGDEDAGGREGGPRA